MSGPDGDGGAGKRFDTIATSFQLSQPTSTFRALQAVQVVAPTPRGMWAVGLMLRIGQAGGVFLCQKETPHQDRETFSMGFDAPDKTGDSDLSSKLYDS